MGVQASEVGHPMEGIGFDGVFQKNHEMEGIPKWPSTSGNPVL